MIVEIVLLQHLRPVHLGQMRPPPHVSDQTIAFCFSASWPPTVIGSVAVSVVHLRGSSMSVVHR